MAEYVLGMAEVLGSSASTGGEGTPENAKPEIVWMGSQEKTHIKGVGTGGELRLVESLLSCLEPWVPALEE